MVILPDFLGDVALPNKRQAPDADAIFHLPTDAGREPYGHVTCFSVKDAPRPSETQTEDD
jgi:hypothetical protein